MWSSSQQHCQHRRRHGDLNDSDTPPAGDAGLAEVIVRIMLEHFGDGLPVHTVVVMDTVQYRLAQTDVATVLQALRDSAAGGGAISEGENGGDDDYQLNDLSGEPHDYGYYYYTTDAKSRPEYCMWADPWVSRVYHGCLMQLVRSGRISVVHDCVDGVYDNNSGHPTAAAETTTASYMSTSTCTDNERK